MALVYRPACVIADISAWARAKPGEYREVNSGATLADYLNPGTEFQGKASRVVIGKGGSGCSQESTGEVKQEGQQEAKVAETSLHSDGCHSLASFSRHHVCVYYVAWAIHVPVCATEYFKYNSFHLTVWVKLGLERRALKLLEEPRFAVLS